MSDMFNFDLSAKRVRLSDADLVSALQAATEKFEGEYFSTTQYDDLPGKRPHSATIIQRFGSWKKALALIGIEGVRNRQYSPEDMVDNLESAWKQLGYPPGKRQIASIGARISESPYKRHWGSVHAACEALASFHVGRISRDILLAGATNITSRKTVPLNDRWKVLKRDNYRCAKCGASPAVDHNIVLEIDHILAVANSGGNELDNLQTLCQKCNQGKKDR
jgi:hypothetical protein